MVKSNNKKNTNAGDSSANKVKEVVKLLTMLKNNGGNLQGLAGLAGLARLAMLARRFWEPLIFSFVIIVI